MEISQTPSSVPESVPRPRISWGAVAGFGSLVLLWPLLELIDVGSAVGRTAAALLSAAVLLAFWALAAGFGRVPRPVVTLTLAGALAGCLVVLTAVLTDAWGEAGLPFAAIGAAIEIARLTGFGALAGLVALWIQTTRRR